MNRVLYVVHGRPARSGKLAGDPHATEQKTQSNNLLNLVYSI